MPEQSEIIKELDRVRVVKKYPSFGGNSYFVSMLDMAAIIAEFQTYPFDCVMLTNEARGSDVFVADVSTSVLLTGCGVASSLRSSAREFFLTQFRPELIAWLKGCQAELQDAQRVRTHKSIVMEKQGIEFRVATRVMEKRGYQLHEVKRQY